MKVERAIEASCVDDREAKPEAPPPVMPRPGPTGVKRDAGTLLMMASPCGKRRWLWSYPECVGGHEQETMRDMSRDEAEAIAMALRGLGWTEVRHG